MDDDGDSVPPPSFSFNIKPSTIPKIESKKPVPPKKKPRPTTSSSSSPYSGFNHLGGGSGSGSHYRPNGGGMRDLGRRRGG